MLDGEHGSEPGSMPGSRQKSRSSRCKGRDLFAWILVLILKLFLQALFLPEASDYIASSAAETVSLVRSVQDSEFVRGLQDEARRASLPINVGIHEPAQGGQKVKNTSIWIDEKGNITHRYQKIHLFDVDIKNGPILKESEYVLERILERPALGCSQWLGAWKEDL